MAFILLTFHSYVGFLNRKNLSSSAKDSYEGFPEVRFYRSRWKFACRVVGHSWYNPKGIGSKLVSMYATLGVYSPSDGDIHINLRSIDSQLNSLSGWRGDLRGYEPPTEAEAVEYIIEHEALHSAIRQHSEIEYSKQEKEFREKWKASSRFEKLQLFYSSVIYGFGGGGVPWNEEWVIKQIQDLRIYGAETWKARTSSLDRVMLGSS